MGIAGPVPPALLEKKKKKIFFFLGEEVRARARFWRDQNLLDRANGMPLKSCDALERIAEAG